MSYEIRSIESEDELNEFLELAVEVFPESLINIDDSDIVFVAYLEGEPVGFIHFGEDRNSYMVKGLGVREEYRRQGIGGTLLEESMQRISGKPVYLKTNSLNPAVNLYSRFGFFMKKFGGECILVRKEIN